MGRAFPAHPFVLNWGVPMLCPLSALYAFSRYLPSQKVIFSDWRCAGFLGCVQEKLCTEPKNPDRVGVAPPMDLSKD